MSTVVSAVPRDALEVETLILVIDDALEVTVDTERREHLRGWRMRLQLELADLVAEPLIA